MRRITKHLLWMFPAALAAGLLSAMVSIAADTSGAKSAPIGPTVKIHRGEQCVEPTEDMRRNHMQHILHQRDKTVHQGIRTKPHSLTNCVDCHADPKTNSVLGQEGFCSSCHEFASVKIDCFSCHTDKRDKNAVAVAPFKGTATSGRKP
ncbi:MAG: hypothetical protein NUV51_11350 [Sulfuricaulis sp.]|nr:hypothetical protein [Sulfuricaulis sp.]